MNNTYAHTGKSIADKSDWQTLDAHLRGTALATAGINPFEDGAHSDSSNPDLNFWDHLSLYLYISGLLHDIGKADKEFQKYLEKALEAELSGDSCQYRCQVNHSEAGAAWAMKNFGNFLGKIFAYIIAGHHAGLPDWNTDNNASLIIRLKKGEKNLESIRNQVDSYINKILPSGEILQKDLEKDLKSCKLTPYNMHLLIRMLFSRLTDADRLDTEAFCNPDQAEIRSHFASIPELKDRFDKYMKKNFDRKSSEAGDPSSQLLQKTRNDVLNACRTAGRSNSDHLFTLTVPTGGGKTLSSMAFALEYAASHHLKRIIYVIPYTSIIEQNANVFRNIFGAENVVEHHSNFDAAKILDKKNPNPVSEDISVYEQRMNLAAENWDAPVILTTNVQFFESLYAAKPSRCRKVHRIAESVVILDEAQMIKEEFLSPCVDVLNHLTDSFNTAVVLCTATQPALTNLNRWHTGAKSLAVSKKIYSDPAELYQNLKRVRFVFDDFKVPHTWEEIADDLEKYDEVLCVVNTRKDAYELYRILADREKERCSLAEEICPENCADHEPETVHLSALMCGEHRSQVIDSIRSRLKENRLTAEKRPLRVISTQLVEAGVDIDFPVVFRALAGLDSIAQAAGRCNREGSLGPEGGLVRVFTPPKMPPAGILLKGANAAINMSVCDQHDMHDPETYTKYFEMFYASLNTVDQKDILKRLSANVPDIPFRTVAEDFQLIEDGYSDTVYVQFGDGSKLIDRLRREGVHRELMRKLQRYCVNIPKEQAYKLKEEGKIEELFPGIIVQSVPVLYDNTVGINLFDQTRSDGYFV